MEHINLILIENEIVASDAVGALGDGEVIAFSARTAQDDDGIGEIGDCFLDVRGHDIRPRGFVDFVFIDCASGGSCIDPAVGREVLEVSFEQLHVGGCSAEFGVHRLAEVDGVVRTDLTRSRAAINRVDRGGGEKGESACGGKWEGIAFVFQQNSAFGFQFGAEFSFFFHLLLNGFELSFEIIDVRVSFR